MFNFFLKNTGESDPANFRGVCLECIAAVEDIDQADETLYDSDIVDGSMIGELASRNVAKSFNTAQLLRSNSHTCYICFIFAHFADYRCLFCDQFIRKEAQHPE